MPTHRATQAPDRTHTHTHAQQQQKNTYSLRGVSIQASIHSIVQQLSNTQHQCKHRHNVKYKHTQTLLKQSVHTSINESAERLIDNKFY